MPSGDTWTSNIMVLQFATIHRNIITGYGCFINFKEHIEVDSPYSFSGGRGSIRVWTLLTIIDVIYNYCFKPWPTEKLCYSPNICSSNRSPFFSGFIIQNGYSFMLLYTCMNLDLTNWTLFQIARAAYGVLIIAIFWVFEVLPLAVTSLLPVLIFPLLGVAKVSAVCSSYFKVSRVEKIIVSLKILKQYGWCFKKSVATIQFTGKCRLQRKWQFIAMIIMVF